MTGPVGLPSGTVTFLFTDLEGSTRRWEEQPLAMAAALARHDALLRRGIEAEGGVVFKTVGDAFCAAFALPTAALAAAVAGQRALAAAEWSELGPLRARMALHTGSAEERDGDYFGPPLNRVARLLAAGHGGQVLISAAVEERTRHALPAGVALRDLGEHRLRDLLQAEHVYQLLAPDLPAAFPPLNSLERHRHNLPPQPTALVGRGREVAAARALLEQAGVRLVTLTGPGGTGKTRLGLQTAAELVDALADGVWFVPLAATDDPALVVPAIAQTLGIREAGDEPLAERLAAYLAPREALLVLDNFEQVAPAAPAVAELLAACPKLKVLATSRAPLRLSGERELPVPPLALPDPGRLPSLAQLLEVEAVRLFAERAQAVTPGFAITAATAPAVAAICHRLDGLPLAIELAAARVRLLPPPALLARLERRLPLLTGGGRDLPDRQRTLRGAIAWSHDLLATGEQVLFARLAVFVNGCTIEAVEAVCGGVGALGLDALDGLDTLAEQSLVRQEEQADGTPRLVMLETIREYALERLAAREEVEVARGRHAAYYLALAEEAEPELAGPDQAAWLDRVETEHDNLRAALSWAGQAGEAATELRLAGALWRFWWVRGHLSEGHRWLERAIGHGAEAPAAFRAKALDGDGVLMATQGDHAPAQAKHEAALALWREIGDRLGIFRSLTNLGIVADDQGDTERAARLYEGALALARELGDRAGIASSLSNLGVLEVLHGKHELAAVRLEESRSLFRDLGDQSSLGGVLANLGMLAFWQGDYEQAAARYEEALALAGELGNRQVMAIALANLGHAVQQQGDLERAAALYGDALDLFRELGDRGGTAFALTHLGRVAHQRGNDGGAETLFLESLAFGQQIGEKLAVAEALEGLAGLACDRGEPARGARLFGTAEALREEIGAPLPTVHRADRERQLVAARAALGEQALAAARAEGRQLAVDDLVAELVNLPLP